MSAADLLPIMVAAFIAAASPGPAILAIAGASMGGGRRSGLATASGVVTGSLFWSGAAAMGFGALMMANAWAIEVLRWAGAAYLCYLAFKAARSALQNNGATTPLSKTGTSQSAAFYRGLAVHLTNPKPILFFGALYAVGVAPGAPARDLAVIFVVLGLQNAAIFLAYALLFARSGARSVYARAGRWFDALTACVFGFAAFKIATARLT